MDDRDRIEQQLVNARDALMGYWEQPEGQACFLALRVAEDALADYRAFDSHAAQKRDAEGWQRLNTLADEVRRLRAPLEGTL